MIFKMSAVELNNSNWQYLKFLADNDALGQAYLLYGLPGVGKASLVERFLQYLFCQEKVRPGGQCLNCHQVLSHIHPDVYWLEKLPGKQDIAIQQVRELRNFIETRSWQNNFRVAVVNLADELNTESANALLKILEEPAAKVIFFLLAVNWRHLPRTIVSRCQLLPIGLTETGAIVELLQSAGADLNLANELAQLAGGRPNQALTWLKDDTSLRERLLLWQELLDLISLNSWPSWQDFVDRNLTKENGHLPNSLSLKAIYILQVLQEISRDVLQVKLGLNELVVYQKRLNELKLLASRWSWSKLDFWLKSLVWAQAKIKANANIRLTFDNLLANLISYEK